MKIEREWRGSLQRNLEQEKEKVTELQAELQQFKQMKKVSCWLNAVFVTIWHIDERELDGSANLLANSFVLCFFQSTLSV